MKYLILSLLLCAFLALFLKHDPEPDTVHVVASRATTEMTAWPQMSVPDLGPRFGELVVAMKPKPRRARLRPPAARAGSAAGSVNGYPCGGDLPPCWVLARESGGDPRVWNGRCYMPPGSLGQCGRSSASGLWQVLRSTWKRFQGYVNAADAPWQVQNEFARRLWNGGRGCSHWSAC